MADTESQNQIVEEIHQELEGNIPPGILQDPNTWVLVPSLLIIALFIWKGVPGLIGKALDDRGQKISDELEEARGLREEAQEVLATYKRRQREAEEEALSIIEQAKNDAKIIAVETRQRMEQQLERRTKTAEAKIARAEDQAIAEVRNRTAEISAAAAEAIIRDRVEGSAQTALVDKAIGDVRAKLN